MGFAEAAHPHARVTDWVKHGSIGGIVAGIAFAMPGMVMTAILSGADAFFMPLRMIGAMLLGQRALRPDYSLAAAGLAGVGVHMVQFFAHVFFFGTVLGIYLNATSRTLAGGSP